MSLRVPELTDKFNRKFRAVKTQVQIQHILSNHGFRSGRKPGRPAGSSIIFTQEQSAYIRKNYPRFSAAELTQAVNQTFGISIKTAQIKSYVKNHGVESGRTGQFVAGHRPWNQGTKGLVAPNSGQFKPGGIPANVKPLGHERICSEYGYILVKVAETNPHTGAPTRYRGKHCVVWEEANGKPPPGFKILFVDGNKQNCNLQNLALITYAELLHLNQLGFSSAPDEVKPSIRALAKLKAKQFSLRKDRAA